MTDEADRRRHAGAALRLTVLAIALTALVVILGSALRDRTAPTAPAQPSAGASAAATEALDASISCRAETGPLPSMLASDPCPEAIVAVKLAAAPARLPFERIVIEPGPFYCDVIWPGVGSPRVCSGYAVRPGQFMHAWVSFRGSDEIAAVMLGLDLPDDLGAPGATRPPWHATLVAVEVPPAGWVMP